MRVRPASLSILSSLRRAYALLRALVGRHALLRHHLRLVPALHVGFDLLKGARAARQQRVVKGRRVEGAPDADMRAAYPGALLVLPLQGEVRSRKGDAVAAAGECLVARNLDGLDFSSAEVTLLTRSSLGQGS